MSVERVHDLCVEAARESELLEEGETFIESVTVYAYLATDGEVRYAVFTSHWDAPMPRHHFEGLLAQGVRVVYGGDE